MSNEESEKPKTGFPKVGFPGPYEFYIPASVVDASGEKVEIAPGVYRQGMMIGCNQEGFLRNFCNVTDEDVLDEAKKKDEERAKDGGFKINNYVRVFPESN